MKAYNLRSIGELRYEDTDIPKLESGWALIKVKAAGICSSDITRIFKKGTYHYPTVPGHEFAGIVVQVADEENKNYIGRKVSVFPLIPCRQCEFCKRGKFELCNNYDYIGSRRNGAFAEYVTAPIWNLVELNDDINYTEAATMEPLAVSLHAINQMQIKGYEDVAIIGTGMIALSAAQWAVLKGAKSVTVIGRSYRKKALVESLENVNYMDGNKTPDRYDTVLEAVGSNIAIEQAITIAKPEGKVILMGNPENDILLQQDVYWRILRKQILIKGTWNSSYNKALRSDWSEVKDILNNHGLKINMLISHVFHQDELIDALDMMRQHKESFCKVMTLWNEEK